MTFLNRVRTAGCNGASSLPRFKVAVGNRSGIQCRQQVVHGSRGRCGIVRLQPHGKAVFGTNFGGLEVAIKPFTIVELEVGGRKCSKFRC
mmetsp:Transcript_29718/g.46577  ORF Transcript_29718/g.46577 Transcript_29718/m.46577 type:complete len:90 (-) Transcript_29718:2303-2572(-)